MKAANLLLVSIGACEAFVAPNAGSAGSGTVRSIQEDTKLHAFAPMIISPIIKKMREENAKKKQPMATENELAAEAPGLRVGSGAWKWPSVWPYDDKLFGIKDDMQQVNQIESMTKMISGGTPATPGEVPENENKLDVKKYWMEDVVDVSTEMEEAAIANLKRHYEYYLRDGMSILEFGAAENSYLPDGLKVERHVGMGLSPTQMDKNPSITEKVVVDFNTVEEGEGIDSEEMRQKLLPNTFDAIIMTNTIDFLTNPREVFRSAWYLLKPGGIMLVSFSSKEVYEEKFSRAQTSMWRDMNDDQHMWVAGSFFQFSAGDGWENLKAFDISPEGAKAPDDNNPLNKLMNKSRPQNMYVVQANKGYQDESVDMRNPEKSFESLMWMLPTMEDRDKMLLAPRLARAYLMMANAEWGDRTAMVDHLGALSTVYESLVKMDQFAFTFSMQAQLAADLVVDEDFVANDEQIKALKMGLGLRTPSEDFWVPVGENTANMDPEDKVNLLAYLVPRFGSGNPEQEAALQSFISGLKPTFAVIRKKCPSLSEGDVELIGTELLCAEILKPGVSTREEYAAWLSALTEEEIVDYLGQRRSFKEQALLDMNEFKQNRAAEEARIAAQKAKMEEQKRKARKERTMAFNPQTGKLEEIKRK